MINSISVIIASAVAVYGITSWRREAKWKRKYELAEEVLTTFYEVKELFEVIRSPFGHTEEGKTRKRDENESSAESERLDRAYVVVERFERDKAAFIKLRTLKYRFMVVYGKESGEPFDKIIRMTNKLFSAARNLGNEYWNQNLSSFNQAERKAFIEKKIELESIIWSDYKNKDAFQDEIDDAIILVMR